MKISRKISLSFLLTAIVLVIAAVTVTHIIIKDTLIHSIYSHLFTAAKSRSHHIETFLNDQRQTIKLLSRGIIFEEVLSTERYSEAYHRKIDRVRDRLDKAVMTYPWFTDMELTDRMGRIVYSTREGGINILGPSLSETPDSVRLSDIYLPFDGSEPQMTITAPVMNDKVPLGMITVRMNLQELYRILGDTTGLGKTGDIYLVNSDSLLISPTRFSSEGILKQKIDTVNTQNAMKWRNDPQSEKDEITVFPDYRGVMVLGTYRYISQMDWILLAEIDVQEAFLPLERMKVVRILTLIIIPLLAWMLGIFVSRWISTPIRKVQRGMEIVGKGDLDHSIGLDSQDEIGELSRAFDRMAVDLKQSVTSIDRLNKEIAERKRAESALQENRQRLKIILDSIPMGMVLIDAESHLIVDVNPAAARLIGLPAETITGKVCHNYICPCEEGQCPITDHHMEIDQSERELVTGDGTILPILKTAVTVLIDGRRHILESFADITEIKRARKDIARLAAVAEQAAETIVITDLNGYITYVNPFFTQSTGYSASEALGQNPRILKSGLQDSDFYKELWDTILSGQVWKGVFINKRKDGTLFHEEATISPVRDSSGEIINYLAVKRDITDRIRAAEELQRAKLDAESANIAKTEFLASMSHEIRTPMNAIIGMAELLNETTLTPEQEQYVQVFQSAGENLLNIINDILDISKVESGKLELEDTEFDLEEIIEKVCEIMAFRSHEKGVELLCEIAPDVPIQLIGDPVRFRQVLINLIGNAIKFTDNGEIYVTVDRYRQDTGTEKEALIFSVKDTGIGIPQEKIGTIFDIFSQADSSTTRKHGGTGLGLTISKRLVELMGGTIWVESEPGQGSTFRFTTPFSVQGDGAKPPTVVPEIDLNGVRILVVDDNDTNRLILKKSLSLRGAIIDEAHDGEDGLNTFLQSREGGEPYRIVLIDGHMPVMDGFDLAERISEVAGSDIAMMMLTSDTRVGDITRCKDIGIDRYFVKPVKQKDLVRAIASLITSPDGTMAPPPGRPKEDISFVISPLNILLAEDSPDNRLLFLSYLKKFPYRIETAENGEIAVERFKSGSFDLVFMDIQMPVMDGYSATMEIRQWEQENDMSATPIIALTAHATRQDAEKSMEAGCTAHLTKPVKKGTLLDAISHYTTGD